MNVNFDVQKQLKNMNVIFGVAAGLWVGWQIFNVVKNYYWHPHVRVLSVDYAKGIAELEIQGKPVTLYRNSTVSAGYNWGVRFNGSAANTVNRIELVNNDMVRAVLNVQ